MGETVLEAGPLVTGPWLVRLRWAAVLAQVTGVAVAVQVLGLALPLQPIPALVVLLAASNLVLRRRVSQRRPAQPPGFRAMLAFDVTLPTLTLSLTRGTSNPLPPV